MKLIKITNCVCVAVYATVVMLLWCALSVYTHIYGHTHTLFVILINFMNFLTNFNLTTCTFQYIHK